MQEKAKRNKTIHLTDKEINTYSRKLLRPTSALSVDDLTNKIILGDLFKVLDYLPNNFIDLLFIDPPYNLTKNFNHLNFIQKDHEYYESWIDSWLKQMTRLLKPNSSIYICCDWKSSAAIFNVGRKYFTPQNRITWEREKGRGAKSNWKNCLEDIWFFTKSNKYTFNVDDVKMKRKVIAPYRDKDGKPKDWNEDSNGNFRITHPSNIWTDISIPFWSMSENTNHPTQKPEKLLAKIILASSNRGDMVFDPFLGSGTTAVAAKKLGRNYSGVEIDEYYCCLAEKRLALSEQNNSIQGYFDGVFWERNTHHLRAANSVQSKIKSQGLFDKSN